MPRSSQLPHLQPVSSSETLLEFQICPTYYSHDNPALAGFIGLQQFISPADTPSTLQETCIGSALRLAPQLLARRILHPVCHRKVSAEHIQCFTKNPLIRTYRGKVLMSDTVSLITHTPRKALSHETTSAKKEHPPHIS